MMNTAKRILIVDDDPEILELLANMVRSLHYDVETANDGFEALAKVGLDIDLILLDVKMPGMDGFEVARSVRKQYLPNELPIIMVTGMASREDRIGAVKAGANEFIAKPFDVTEVRVRMKSQLEMKEAHDALRKHKEDLEGIVKKRTQALRSALDDVVEARRRLRVANLETIALTHHEKWDGSGYPKGVRGDEIPIEGRICAIADVFDALTSKRPYKEAFSNDKAFHILWEGRGKHFDPNLVAFFVANVDEVIEIQSTFLSQGRAEEAISKQFSSARSTL